MKIFNKVTLQSLKKNKVRTIVTIIGIMLSTALICAVTTSFASARNFAIGYYEYTEGKWHGLEQYTDKDTYDLIEGSDKVKDTGVLSYIGYADIGSTNSYKPYLYISGYEEDETGIIPIHMISGRMPENSSEILLPEHLSANGEVELHEGDKLTLEIGDRMPAPEKVKGIADIPEYIDIPDEAFDDYILKQDSPFLGFDDEDGDAVSAEKLIVRETREYTVVGFYERPDFEDIYCAGYTALTVPDEYTDDTMFTVYYRMNNMKDIYDFMKENKLDGMAHSDLLMFSGVSKYKTFYSVVYGLATVVIGLIMFGSIMLIYNAFAISVADRTKQFGLLSSIGATKKQLRKMVRFEAISLGAIGIPLGIILGIVGMWVTFLAIGSRFSAFVGDRYPEPMRICVSPIAIAAACVIAFVTIMISAWIPSIRATRITAVEAIRQSKDIKQKKHIKTPKIIQKLFGVSGVLAHKYFKRSKKKYRATIISLFLSIVLFISAYSFTAYLVSAIKDANNSFGMDYILNVYEPDGVEDASDDPLEILHCIRNTEHITDSAFYLRDYGFRVYTDESNIQEDYIKKNGVMYDETNEHIDHDGFRLIDQHFYYVDDDSFRQLLKSEGLSESEFMNKDHPLGILVDNTLLFNEKSGRMERTKVFNNNDFDITLLKNKKIEGYYYSGDYIDSAIYVNIEDELDKMYVPYDECLEDITMHIGKVTDKRPYFVSSYGVSVIYPYSFRKEILGDYTNDMYSYEYAINADDTKAGYEALKTTLKENGIPDGEFWNYAESIESERSMIVIVKVFAYGFIVLISLIAAANVFNTITTNINLRRREFAMLKSVGMTAKGMRRMLNYECLLYGTKALLYGLPVSVGVTYLIYLSINEGIDTSFFVPWVAVAVAVLSVFLVVFSTMMFSMSKIKKDNPIDALKNENL